jgi:hypothetical protein
MNFNWKKVHKIYTPKKKLFWNKSYAMLPSNFKLKKNIYRIFFASRNSKNQSFISFVDYDLFKKKIIYFHKKPCLSPGKLGCFDDNGVVPSSLIKAGKKIYLYYIGWKPQTTTRYSLLAGLAISINGGYTFKRFKESPILNLSDKEPYSILTAPCVIKEKKLWKMWYVSGIIWKNKDTPKYNIKYAFSKNGRKWTQNGKVCIALKKNERAVARPAVIKIKDTFYMWYCREKKSGNYRLGYAKSKNGINWKRVDHLNNLKISKHGWDSKMICYPNLFINKKRLYMLYNGNTYGKNGFGVAFSEIF